MHRKHKLEADERLAELASILAIGLQRVLARQSSAVSSEFGESSLHSSPTQSGDGPVSEKGATA